ncbi:hypothetical protein TNCV_3069711 [Trichonephila clavipes]|nr:hypothetical protein TNCV_3069711 [Trichonephila clavipes]
MECFIKTELEDLRLIYGLAKGNARALERLFRERYLQIDAPDHRMYANLHHNLCEYGSLQDNRHKLKRMLRGEFWLKKECCGESFGLNEAVIAEVETYFDRKGKSFNEKAAYLPIFIFSCLSLERLTAVSLNLGLNPGEGMDVCKCIASTLHEGTLNSRSGKRRTVRTEEAIATVERSIEEVPKESIRHRAQELDLCP